MSMVTKSELNALYEELKTETRRLLAAHGFSYTCNTPGSLWLYEKRMPDGRVLLVSESTALDMVEEPDDADDE
jgi:hypothetical protein